MLELEFEGRRFSIEKSELMKLLNEASKELLDKEKRDGIISQFGMFGIASNLHVANCFACGDFEDYSSKCKYNSRVKVKSNEKVKTLCKRSDMPAVYAIQSGKMGQHEMKPQ